MGRPRYRTLKDLYITARRLMGEGVVPQGREAVVRGDQQQWIVWRNGTRKKTNPKQKTERNLLIVQYMKEHPTATLGEAGVHFVEAEMARVRKGGMRQRCKPCVAKRSDAWYKTEHGRQKMKEWQIKNKDKMRRKRRYEARKKRTTA